MSEDMNAFSGSCPTCGQTYMGDADKRLDRLENIAEALCVAVLSLSGNASWAGVFDPLRDFRDELQGLRRNPSGC